MRRVTVNEIDLLRDAAQLTLTCDNASALRPRCSSDDLRSRRRAMEGRHVSQTGNSISIGRVGESKWLRGRASFALSVALCMMIPRAAQATDDFATWYELGVKAHVTQKLSLGVFGHLRFDENSSRLKSVMPEAEVGYRLWKHQSLAVGYRLSYRRTRHEVFEWAHRGYADLNSRLLKVGDVRLGHRLRLQDEFDWTRKGRLKDEPTLRNAIKIDYRGWELVRPFTSAEHFLALDTWEEGATRKWWFTTGLQLAAKPFEWELFYRLELLADTTGDPRTHIVGLAAYFETDL